MLFTILSNKLYCWQYSNLGLEFFQNAFFLKYNVFIALHATAAKLGHSVGSSSRGAAMSQHAAMSSIVLCYGAQHESMYS